MNVKHFSRLALMLCAASALAQPYPVGIRSQAMGGGGVAHGRDAEVMFSNPALLANLPGSSITVFYSRPFGLREINLATLAAATKFGNFSGGLAIVDFGNDLYRDRYIHVALARGQRGASPFAVALAAHLRHLAIQGYGSAITLGIDLGTSFQASPKLSGGVFVFNINRPAIGAAREKQAVTACAGIAFSPRQDWLLQVDYFREIGFDGELRFGLEARALRHLVLRAGAATNPDRLSAGLAIELGAFSLQAAANTHSELGTTQFYAASLGRR